MTRRRPHSAGPRAPAPLQQLRDLELLLNAHHPIIFLETVEEERAEVLLEHVADHLDLLFLTWAPGRGLQHPRMSEPLVDTADPSHCLNHIIQTDSECLYYLRDFVPLLEENGALRARLKDAHKRLWEDRSAIMLTGESSQSLRPELARFITSVTLAPPTDLEYHQYISELVRDMRKRHTVRMQMTSRDVAQLIQQLRGLTFFEVKKVITQAIADDWSLDRKDIARALDAKKEVLSRTGVLEFWPAKHGLEEVAGLRHLKGWLRKRKAVFEDPTRAQEFGLSAPRGILLLGVPGCGKSLSAKAVAREYGLPLLRLDPAKLYTKFIGETEQNLRRAIRAAEATAPIVLWIDEIEKGLGHANTGSDAGVSQRVFGTLLSWLQDKPDGVFVVATCNDPRELPPELMRKGRFDEIFFVDLPDAAARAEILSLHLTRRGRDAAQFDVASLAGITEGFSGSELEQAVVSALYAAYADHRELTTEHISAEIAATRPLSVTSAEKIEALRAWASDRTVAAD